MRSAICVAHAICVPRICAAICVHCASVILLRERTITGVLCRSWDGATWTRSMIFPIVPAYVIHLWKDSRGGYKGACCFLIWGSRSASETVTRVSRLCEFDVAARNSCMQYRAYWLIRDLLARLCTCAQNTDYATARAQQHVAVPAGKSVVRWRSWTSSTMSMVPACAFTLCMYADLPQSQIVCTAARG
jgi:hypothetical protein